MNGQVFDRDFSLAHALLRVGLGVDLCVHGLARLPQLGVFVGHMQAAMAKTWLPLPLVTATAYVIPFVEFALGALLILGLFLRLALVFGSLLMIVLMFGICLTQNWTVAAEQLVYMFVFAALLASARHDRFSIRSLARSLGNLRRGFLPNEKTSAEKFGDWFHRLDVRTENFEGR